MSSQERLGQASSMLPKRRGSDSSDPCILPLIWWRLCVTCCGGPCQPIATIRPVVVWVSLLPEWQMEKMSWYHTSTTRRSWCRCVFSVFDTVFCSSVVLYEWNQMSGYSWLNTSIPVMWQYSVENSLTHGFSDAYMIVDFRAETFRMKY